MNINLYLYNVMIILTTLNFNQNGNNVTAVTKQSETVTHFSNKIIYSSGYRTSHLAYHHDLTGSEKNEARRLMKNGMPKRVRRQGQRLNMCMEHGTCNMNSGAYLPICYCDEACQIYEDCCFDSTQFESEGHQDLRHLKEKIKYIACQTGLFAIGINTNITGSFMISDCPATYPFEDIALKCNKSKGIFPVTANDGITYRNIYCATCHNVSDYTVWKFGFIYNGDCHPAKLHSFNFSDISTKIEFIMDHCSYRFDRPSNSRVCILSQGQESISSTQEELCSKFTNPVKVLPGNIVYKNMNCIPTFAKEIKCRCVVSKRYITSGRGYGSLLMTGLFNIRPVLEMFGQKICKNDEIYDDTVNVCIPGHCKIEPDDKCHFELTKNYKLKAKSLDFFSNGIIDKDFVLRVVTFFYMSLPRESYGIIFTRGIGSIFCRSSILLNHQKCCVFVGDGDFVLSEAKTSKEILGFKSEVNAMKWSYTEIRNHTKISAWNYEADNVQTKQLCNITGSNRLYRMRLFSYTIKPQMKYFKIFNNTRSETEVPTSSEALIRIEKGVEDLLQINIEKWDLQYRKYNATEPTTLNTKTEIVWKGKTILTYVTMGISCIMLLVTMSVYGYVGMSDSSSGIITLNMMATLLAAQLLFTFGAGAEHIKVVCFIIGVISHYLWLSSFSWISVFLVEVLKDMRKMYTSPGALMHEAKQVSKLSFCIGYLIPILVVCPCIFLELFSEFKIEYTGSICFPTGFPANLIVFTVPVVASLVVNVISLVVTIVLISRFNSTTLHSGSIRKLRDFIPIYIRLSVLCACPWVIGIISDILDSDILHYIFILLAGSHGTFVSICFLSGAALRNRMKHTNTNKTKQKAEINRNRAPVQRHEIDNEGNELQTIHKMNN